MPNFSSSDSQRPWLVSLHQASSLCPSLWDVTGFWMLCSSVRLPSSPCTVPPLAVRIRLTQSAIQYLLLLQVLNQDISTKTQSLGNNLSIRSYFLSVQSRLPLLLMQQVILASLAGAPNCRRLLMWYDIKLNIFSDVFQQINMII